MKTEKLLSVRDLKDDKIDFTLDVSTLEDTDLRSNGSLVSESCLLVASRWRTLKPTFFDFKDVPILKRQDIFAFRVNDKIVDKAYLINELHADYVLEQLESYRIGVGPMQVISKDDLMEVVIKLPSLEEQRAKMQGIYELSEKIKMLQDERNALAHGTSVNQFNEFASLNTH
ncbi:MAG: restriction endonuclease subunit S [Saprospiraceae bacterium]|nr:restriction endonuclease subunit S [Saprospiraceae bacterium]